MGGLGDTSQATPHFVLLWREEWVPVVNIIVPRKMHVAMLGQKSKLIEDVKRHDHRAGFMLDLARQHPSPPNLAWDLVDSRELVELPRWQRVWRGSPPKYSQLRSNRK